uniref:Uncharacterized protein n=1 Tax=Octopus bimaculoides TaxID=37653 RepID=A0A0L8GQD5_OCTBM
MASNVTPDLSRPLPLFFFTLVVNCTHFLERRKKKEKDR